MHNHFHPLLVDEAEHATGGGRAWQREEREREGGQKEEGRRKGGWRERVEEREDREKGVREEEDEREGGRGKGDIIIIYNRESSINVGCSTSLVHYPRVHTN